MDHIFQQALLRAAKDGGFALFVAKQLASIAVQLGEQLEEASREKRKLFIENINLSVQLNDVVMDRNHHEREENYFRREWNRQQAQLEHIRADRDNAWNEVRTLRKQLDDQLPF